MGRWDPLPPGRSERWLVKHRVAVHVSLVLASALILVGPLWMWLGKGNGNYLAFFPVGLLVLWQVVIVEINVRRTRRWDAEHSAE